MVHQMIDGTYRQTNLPNESPEYLDELNPIWNVLDLTPQGRGTFYASLEYGVKVHAARR